MLNEEQFDLCKDAMKDLSHKELRDILNELVLPYFDKTELIDMMQDRFMAADWNWFYEEYIAGVE